MIGKNHKQESDADKRGLSRTAAFSLALALLAGCSAKQHMVQWDEIKASQGVLITSVVATETCWVWDKEVSLQSESRHQVARFFPHNALLSSDFPDIHGQVHVIPLDPGRYYFVVVSDFLTMAYAPLFLDLEELRSVSVNAGEIVYAGEMRINGCDEAQLSVQDHWARDRLALDPVYRLLPLEEVRIRLAR